ncbi:MAG: branched-chain amino acid ABC transporter permease [Acidimicrobiia bacterium]|nr:branched-chain amino acid ABC transporter permease [Acidimicrobiia bacterium]
MEKFFQLLVAGIAVGGIYAIIALGFVVVYKVSGTFNFSQGGLVLLGAFVTYQYSGPWGMPFFVALALAVVTLAGVAMVAERVVIRPMIGKPPFAMLLITIGLLVIIEQLVRSIWTEPGLVLKTPWGNDRYDIAGVTIRHADLWTMGTVTVLFAAFFVFFSRTDAGLGIRATAFDQEAAAAQGIPVSRAFSVSWAIAGAVAVVAGVMLTSRGGSALSPGLGLISLRALPAMIIGGLDSPGGAIAGGVIVGVTEIMAQGYLDNDTTGNVATIAPYVVMIIVLLWRPSGLFGTRAVERV